MMDLLRVSKLYRKGSLTVRALHDVNLAVDEGEFLVIQGPSGSGKTTLLNVLGLLDRPTSGVVRIRGIDATDMDSGTRARLRGRFFGFVFQGSNLIPQLTAWQNVALPLRYAGVSRHERRARAVAALERLGLGERIHHRPGELSGGEEQRVAIARSLVIEPGAILADEPTGNLDSETSDSIMRYLGDLNHSGATLIIVTHDSGIARSAFRLVRLVDGILLEA